MRICLFDIDGTLLNTGGAGQAAMEMALSEEFGIMAPSEGIPTAGRTDRAITEDLFKQHGIGLTDDSWGRFQHRYLSLLPDTLTRHQGAVLPGIPRLLRELGDRSDVQMGLLTGNFESGGRLKLQHYGLDGHFGFGGFGDVHRDRDDVARAARDLAIERFPDASTPELWVIGDTPADIQCGRAIGAQVVAVATGIFSAGDLGSAKPDLLLPSFRDLAPWWSLFDD